MQIRYSLSHTAHYSLIGILALGVLLAALSQLSRHELVTGESSFPEMPLVIDADTDSDASLIAVVPYHLCVKAKTCGGCNFAGALRYTLALWAEARAPPRM